MPGDPSSVLAALGLDRATEHLYFRLVPVSGHTLTGVAQLVQVGPERLLRDLRPLMDRGLVVLNEDRVVVPALADVLRAMGVDALIVAGLQSEHCVQATAIGAAERGFDVVVPAGAHATYDDDAPAAEIVERVELDLDAAGVEVVELDEVRFR